MARILDLVQYPDEMRNEIVHRFPESGPGDFRIGSNIIVRENQAAVFFRDGRALDAFGPGRTIITTANIPVLVDYVGLVTILFLIKMLQLIFHYKKSLMTTRKS